MDLKEWEAKYGNVEEKKEESKSIPYDEWKKKHETIQFAPPEPVDPSKFVRYTDEPVQGEATPVSILEEIAKGLGIRTKYPLTPHGTPDPADLPGPEPVTSEDYNKMSFAQKLWFDFAKQGANMQPGVLGTLMNPAEALTMAGTGGISALRLGRPVAKEMLSWGMYGIPDIYKGVLGGYRGVIAGLGAKAREAAIPVEKAMPISMKAEQIIPSATVTEALKTVPITAGEIRPSGETFADFLKSKGITAKAFKTTHPDYENLINEYRGISTKEVPTPTSKLDQVVDSQVSTVKQARALEAQRGSIGSPIGTLPPQEEVSPLREWGQSIVNKSREKLEAGKNAFDEVFRYENVIRGHPGLVDDFRLFQEHKQIAVKKAFNSVDGILGGLKTRDEYKIFNKYILNKDLEERLLNQLPAPKGKTLEQVQSELASLERIMTPEVRRATEKHFEVTRAMWDDLVASGKVSGEGFEHYYPHYVLDYWVGKETSLQGRATGKLFKTGVTKEAHGSVREIEEDYIKSMTKRLAQHYYDDAKDSFVNGIVNRYNKMERLWPSIQNKYKFSEGRQPGVGEIFEIEGKRWKTWQPEPGNRIYPVRTEIENAIMKAVERDMTAEELGMEIINSIAEKRPALGPGVLKDNIKLTSEALAIGNKKPIVLLPEEIATRLDDLISNKADAHIIRFLNNMTSKWKGLTIDFGGTAWNIINVMGDMKNLFRIDPMALGKMPRAIWELGRETWGKGSEFASFMDKMGISQAGYIRAEAPLTHQEFLRFANPVSKFYGSTLGKGREFWRDVLNVREESTRWASAIKNLERLENASASWDANPLLQTTPKDIYIKSQLKSMPYNKDVIDALTPNQLLAKTAREFTVDYGKFTAEENKLFRGLLFPFYSWTRQNTPNWYTYIARKPVEYAAKFAIPYVAMEVYNNTQFPEVEGMLSPYQRANPHLITPWKDKDGKRIMFSFRGDPTQDAFSVVGMDKLPSRISDLLTERITIGKAAKDQMMDTLLSPVQTVGQLINPLLKAPFEAALNVSLMTGSKIYPEAFRKQPSELYPEIGMHVTKSLLRPIREKELFDEMYKTGKIDPLTYRYLGGLPIIKIDEEKLRIRQVESEYYKLRDEYVNQRLSLLKDIPGFQMLPKSNQDSLKAIYIDKYVTEFERQYPKGELGRKQKTARSIGEFIANMP